MLPLTEFEWEIPPGGFAIAVAPPLSVGRGGRGSVLGFRTDPVARAEWLDPEDTNQSGDRVLIPRTPARPRFYKPLFEQPGLFRRFADLAESEIACAEFASRFGSHRKRRVYVLPPWNPEKLQRQDFTAIQDPFIAGVDLGLEWDIDIRKLRSVLKLHDAIASADLGVIDKLVSCVVRDSQPVNTAKILKPLATTISREDPLEGAKAVRDHGISQGLEREVDGEPIVRPAFIGGALQMFPSNLLGAMWLQFAVAVQKGKQFRKCPARNCLKVWFEVSTGQVGVREDADFCSARCRHTAYRDRKSAARSMHSAGTPVNEIAKKLETKDSSVRSWLKTRGTPPPGGKLKRPQKRAN